MAQTVVVEHDPSLAPPGALVAALNGAMLEASLTIPRAQAQVLRGRLAGRGGGPLPCMPCTRACLGRGKGRVAAPRVTRFPALAHPIPVPARLQVRGRWVPPWHVLAGALLLAVSLLHYLAGPAGAPGLDYLEYVSLGSVALCLPRIALRALLALRRGVSAPGRLQPRSGGAAWDGRAAPAACATLARAIQNPAGRHLCN